MIRLIWQKTESHFYSDFFHLNHAIQYELLNKGIKKSWYNHKIYCDIWLCFLKFWLKTIVNLCIRFPHNNSDNLLRFFLTFCRDIEVILQTEITHVELHVLGRNGSTTLTEALLSGSNKKQKQPFADILQTRFSLKKFQESTCVRVSILIKFTVLHARRKKTVLAFWEKTVSPFDRALYCKTDNTILLDPWILWSLIIMCNALRKTLLLHQNLINLSFWINFECGYVAARSTMITHW